VDDRPTTEWDPIALRRRIGYVIQDGGLFPHFTVEQNVGLVPRLLGWPPAEIQRRVNELLKMLGLPAAEFASRYPRELSGGQRQRVGVARAMAAHQSLLLFDEPFGGLDPVTRLELQRQFIALRRELGTSSMFVTHDVQEALFLGTHIAVMARGAIEFVGPAHEFLAAPTAEARAFLDCLHAPEERDGRRSAA
jgi:osmoprotectant transport system ATP-binding protein